MAIQFLISGSGSAFVQPAVDSMGYGDLYILLAALTTLGYLSIGWLYFYGEKNRKSYPRWADVQLN